jgi:hypothetical protein
MRLGPVVVFAYVSDWVSLCGRLLEMGVVGVVSLGREFWWVVEGCALGGVCLWWFWLLAP